MTQSRYVRGLLEALQPGLQVEILEIVTSGDKILDSPLSKIGDRGLFVKEIEEALLSGAADLAVHSAKDVPTDLPEGLGLVAFPEREDAADVFVGPLSSAPELGPGKTIGTSSLRRRSQLLARFPGLEVVDIRGNVETRIRKIAEEGLDGTILAAAGLKRLGRFEEASFVFTDDDMLSAVGQGSLAIEARLDDERITGLLSRLDHAQTRAEVLAERALMRYLEGGCQVPIGARARVDGASLVLTAYVGTVDGSRSVRMQRSGLLDDPHALGEELAAEMIAAGAESILAEVRGAAE
jgi:hydroxymethylbilane synthase